MIPIFIVGSPRSGTTCISRCIRSAPGLPGYDEGHFLSNLLDFAVLRYNITEAIKNNPHECNEDVAASKFAEYFHEGLLYHIFKTSYEKSAKYQYEKIYVVESDRKRDELPLSSKYFVDKSPGSKGILITKYLTKIWPQAKFIFMKRRSLENIYSRMKKFENNKYTEKTFRMHCTQWRDDMSNWLIVKEEIDSDNYIEIDQFDIMFNPHETAIKLCKLLPDLLTYKNHMTNYMKNRFPESTQPTFETTNISGETITNVERPKIFNIDTIDWRPKYKKIHNEICESMLSKYGYTTDSTYKIHVD